RRRGRPQAQPLALIPPTSPFLNSCRLHATSPPPPCSAWSPSSPATQGRIADLADCTHCTNCTVFFVAQCNRRPSEQPRQLLAGQHGEQQPRRRQQRVRQPVTAPLPRHPVAVQQPQQRPRQEGHEQ